MLLLNKSNILLLLVTIVVTSAGLAHAAASASTPLKNPVTQAAQAAGVVDCAPRIDQMTSFLLGDNQGGVHTFFPAQHANRSLLSTSFEVITGEVSSYAVASYAPVGKGGCGAVYEAITYWQNSCAEVASKAFAKMKRTGTLKRVVQVLEAGTAARVFLMPAGSGCMSIKKEIIY